MMYNLFFGSTGLQGRLKKNSKAPGQVLSLVLISYESALNPLNSQDLIGNSSYCLLCSSCGVSFENLVLDQLIIP